MTSEAPLSSQTVDAIWDLFGPLDPPSVDDAALLALALGVADQATRLACAQAMLASPSAQTRYLVVRARVRDQLGLEPDFAGTLGLPARAELFVSRLAQTARSIERLAAEGRWTDAEARLRSQTSDLRAAWRLAGSAGLWEEAEEMVRALIFPMMEMRAAEEFSELLALGYQASEALDKPKLRSILLSYEGVWFARLGDPARARELWWERVELNRSLGNPVAEADALLDIADSLRQFGDQAGLLAMLDKVERAVVSSGRPDLEAGFWGLLAEDRLDKGDVATAIEHGVRALEILRRAENAIGVAPHVRFTAARAFTADKRYGEALELLADCLETCVENGQASSAAATLTELAVALEASGGIGLARRCLEVSFAIHRELGTRHVKTAEKAVEDLAARHPEKSDDRLTPPGEAWVSESSAILAILRDLRSAPAPS